MDDGGGSSSLSRRTDIEGLGMRPEVTGRKGGLGGYPSSGVARDGGTHCRGTGEGEVDGEDEEEVDSDDVREASTGVA